MRKAIPILAVLVLVTACTGLYRGVITITSVVDNAAKEYAALYNKGVITADVDAKVTKAHDQYRAACKIASDALKAYKLTGDNQQYVAALQAAKVAATGFIDMIVPLLTQKQATTLKTNLEKAKVL